MAMHGGFATAADLLGPRFLPAERPFRLILRPACVPTAVFFLKALASCGATGQRGLADGGTTAAVAKRTPVARDGGGQPRGIRVGGSPLPTRPNEKTKYH